MSILELKITLEYIEPVVTRTLHVPAGIRLDRLHLTIQAAMGWQNVHPYWFCIGEPYGELYQWGLERWVAPDFVDNPEDLPADKWSLEEAALKAGEMGLTYLYDLEDNWEHRIEISNTCKVDPSGPYPRLTEIAGTCPPEDVGGPPGFGLFVEAMADPKHPEHADLKNWYGGSYYPNLPNSDKLRLEVFSLAERWEPKKNTNNLSP